MIEAVYSSHKVWKCDFETQLLMSKLLKTNERELAKYWLELEDEEEEDEEGGEEYREVTWNECGTEQTDNCTFHHGKGNENQQLAGRIYLCT